MWSSRIGVPAVIGSGRVHVQLPLLPHPTLTVQVPLRPALVTVTVLVPTVEYVTGPKGEPEPVAGLPPPVVHVKVPLPPLPVRVVDWPITTDDGEAEHVGGGGEQAASATHCVSTSHAAGLQLRVCNCCVAAQPPAPQPPFPQPPHVQPLVTVNVAEQTFGVPLISREQVKLDGVGEDTVKEPLPLAVPNDPLVPLVHAKGMVPSVSLLVQV